MGLQISLLGTFRVLRDGVPLQGFESRRVRALLAYLVLEMDRLHSRDTLASLLWPDVPERRARHNLSQALFNLRKVLGDGDSDDYLLITAQTVQFNPESDFSLDVDRLRTLLESYERHPHRRIEGCDLCREFLAQIADLYQGPLLADLHLHLSPSFEEWLLLQRERLDIRVQRALLDLLHTYGRRGAYAEAEEIALRLLQLTPWLEEVHAYLMRLLAVQGHRSRALRQYRACCEILAKELDTDPTPETQDLARRIREGATDPVSLGLQVPSCRLPALTTPFVGRQSEEQAIVDLFQTRGVRLVTIAGMGGSGKTYLAIHAAQRLRYAFRDGIFFVPLASLETAAALPTAIAEGLDIPFFGERTPEEQVLAYLQERDLLLILDGFEHLLPETGFLERILEAAPDIGLLVTTRIPLRLQAEHVIPLGGLAYPEDTTDDLERYPAVQLFVGQVQRLNPQAKPLQDEPDAVIRLCQLVEGMPLSLLLAAAWMRTLSCQEIVTRVQSDLDFLQAHWPDLPPRHRSLYATLDYSWRLLNATEQQVLRELSVFRGTFSAEAAHRVAGATPEILQTLAEKMLLMTTASTGRYALHEQLRQYAQEKLQAHPEDQRQALARHVAYYAGQVRQMLESGSQDDAGRLSALEADHENIRAAWQQALATQDDAALDSLTEGLYRYYQSRSWFHEAAELLRRVLTERGEHLNPVRRVVFQRWLGEACFKCGQLAESEHHLRQVLEALGWPMPKSRGRLLLGLGLEVIRQISHRVRMPRPATDPTALLEGAWAYERLAQCLFFRSDALPMIYAACRGINLAERAGPSPELTRHYASMCLGLAIAPQRRLARIYARLTRDMVAQIADEEARAWALEVLSLYHCGIGEWTDALEAANQAIEIARALGDRRRMEEAMVTPTLVAHYQGDLERAAAMWLDLYRLAEARYDPQIQSWCSTGYAEVQLLLGQNESALYWMLRGQSLMADIVDEINLASCYGGLALAYCRLNRPERALRAIEQMVPLLQKAPSAFSMLEGYANLGEACLMLSTTEWASSSTARQERLDALTREALRAMRRFARAFPIGRPRYYWLAGRHAWLMGRHRQARRHWQRGMRVAQNLGMRYEFARLYHELHVRLGEKPADDALPAEVQPFWSTLRTLDPGNGECRE